jgi:Tfp pilus assembly protein PilN
MRAVNLLPRDEARSGPGLPSPWIFLAAAVPVVAGSLVYFGYSTEHAKVSDKRAELAIVQARLDRLNARMAGLQSQTDLVGMSGQRKAALADALSKSVAWDVTLQDLARILPKGVFLTNLTLESPTPSSAKVTQAPAPTTTTTTTTSGSSGTTTPASSLPIPVAPPTSATIQGFAADHNQIAELIERLSLLPMLTNVTLTNTSTQSSQAAKGTKAGPSQIQFVVAAGILSVQKGSGQ